MNRFLQRVVAYVVDILVVSIFATCIANIGFINVQLKDYNKVYQAYTEETKKYNNFVSDVKDAYKDKKIEEKEFSKLEKNYKASNEYYQILEKKYDDKKITKKEYDQILKDCESKYQKVYKEYFYQIKKYSVVTNVIYIVVILAYFVGFQLLTNGQTLGKKIMKLRVASIKDGQKPTALQYFIRALILYNTIFYLTDILIITFVSKASSYNVLYAFGMLQNVVEWIILFMIAMNQDGRGLHDYLASTIVLGVNEEYDHKKNKEVKDAKFEEKEKAPVVIEKEESKKEEKKPKKSSTTKKEVTKEDTKTSTKPAKKKTTSKTTSKKREKKESKK